MRLPCYHVDAFTANTFGGNPAAVCPLEKWLPDTILQQIAAENNLSETAFFIAKEDYFDLRWFSPTVEVDLCGHATLATAYVLSAELGHRQQRLRFQTQSGWLAAERDGDMFDLDFPAWVPKPYATPDELSRGLGSRPQEVLRTRDIMAVFSSQAEVAALEPDMALLTQLDCLGVIATAPGEQSDFVSRFFAPRAGIPEDPATGSSHSSLIPYWSGRLGKSDLLARQLSRRGGEFRCRQAGERVGIAGRAVIYSRGELELPAAH